MSITLVYCGQTVGWIKMKLGKEVGVGPDHIVLDGDPATPKRGHSPQFSAHVCCSQTAGWIKMLVGMELGLGLATLSPPKGAHLSPQFSPMSVVAKRLDRSRCHLVAK